MLPIKQFDRYFAGDDGNIYSTKKSDLPIQLKARPTKTSKYLRVTLSRGKERIYEGVHVLICKTFKGDKKSNNLQASHNDGNHLNNKPHNLSWKTCLSNHRDKRIHGTLLLGLKHQHSKFTNQKQIDEIKERCSGGETYESIARDFGVNGTTISRIYRGLRYG